MADSGEVLRPVALVTGVGAVIAFLVGAEGSWINGQLIKADGGFSA